MLCKFCKIEQSEDHFYKQPNKSAIGYILVCRIQKRQNAKNWDLNNRDKMLAKLKKGRDRRRSTPQGKLRHSFSSMLSARLSGKSGVSAFDLVNYSIEDLKKHLESKFQPGMTWNNYGQWHVDHVKPDSLFDYSNPKDEDFKKSWALENLQPLWAKDNQSKGNRRIG